MDTIPSSFAIALQRIGLALQSGHFLHAEICIFQIVKLLPGFFSVQNLAMPGSSAFSPEVERGGVFANQVNIIDLVLKRPKILALKEIIVLSLDELVLMVVEVVFNVVGFGAIHLRKLLGG